MTNERYKWANPFEWLMDYASRPENQQELFSLLETCAQRLNSDQLQDLFESDMSADGYFDTLPE